MKTKGKAWHLVVTVLLILAFVYTAFFGVSAKYGDVTTTYIKGAKDIRFGVDIKGGVNVTFVPSEDYDATEEQLEAAQLVIENRLVALNVTDYELYVGRRSTAFPKCRLPKGDAEPQVIIFIKMQKKTLNRRPRWDY